MIAGEDDSSFGKEQLSKASEENEMGIVSRDLVRNDLDSPARSRKKLRKQRVPFF